MEWTRRFLAESEPDPGAAVTRPGHEHLAIPQPARSYQGGPRIMDEVPQPGAGARTQDTVPVFAGRQPCQSDVGRGFGSRAFWAPPQSARRRSTGFSAGRTGRGRRPGNAVAIGEASSLGSLNQALKDSDPRALAALQQRLTPKAGESAERDQRQRGRAMAGDPGLPAHGFLPGSVRRHGPRRPSSPARS